MNFLGLCFVFQISLIFGLAGLLWPEKLTPLFEILMFPWVASSRSIRGNSLVAIGLSIILMVALLTGYRG